MLTEWTFNGMKAELPKMRARNIKPGFFKNDQLSECTAFERLLFIGLWCLADREGRIEDRPKWIRAEVFPIDSHTAEEVDTMLNSLAKNKLILRYEAEGGKYIWVRNFIKHQSPHHMEVPSELPAPPGIENHYSHTRINKSQRQRIMSRDGFRCVHCGAKENLTVDHIIPRAKGGGSSDGNLQTLCKPCNCTKGDDDNETLITRRPQVDDDSTTTRHQVDENGSHPTDSLIPDSLIPDSLIPVVESRETLGGDPLKAQAAGRRLADRYFRVVGPFGLKLQGAKEAAAIFEYHPRRTEADINAAIDAYKAESVALNKDRGYSVEKFFREVWQEYVDGQRPPIPPPKKETVTAPTPLSAEMIAAHNRKQLADVRS